MNAVCQKCGNAAIQDTLVLVEDENLESSTLSNSNILGKRIHTSLSVAGLHATIKRKERFESIVQRGLKEPNATQLKFDDKDICLRCANLLNDHISGYVTEETEIGERIRMFLGFEKESHERRESDIKKFQEDIGKLNQEEEALEKFLVKLEEEYDKALCELEDVKKFIGECKAEEQEYWEACNEYSHRLNSFREECEGISCTFEYAEERLNELKKTNVQRDIFYIATEDKIASINGCRMGRLPDVQVDWEEINAGWGQCILLLYSIARRLNLKFEKYNLRPLGNRSTLEDREANVYHQLYGSDSLGFGQSWFWDFAYSTRSSFDEAMVAFLQCLQDVCKYAESSSVPINLPSAIKIHKDKIGGKSIKMYANSEENWTLAVKNVLIVLDCLLTWISTMKS